MRILLWGSLIFKPARERERKTPRQDTMIVIMSHWSGKLQGVWKSRLLWENESLPHRLNSTQWWQLPDMSANTTLRFFVFSKAQLDWRLQTLVIWRCRLSWCEILTIQPPYKGLHRGKWSGCEIWKETQPAICKLWSYLSLWFLIFQTPC